MQRSTIVLFEPVARIKGKKLDLGAFGEVCWFVNDKPTGFHAGPQGHDVTVASERRLNKTLHACRERSEIATGWLPVAKNIQNPSEKAIG